MAKIHVVKQGEHISSIASKYGFYDFNTLWNDPANADLKALRKNPNVLYPGDQISIRDKKIKEAPRPIDNSNPFKLKRSKLTLHLVLENIYHQPIANAQCQLQVDGSSFDLTSDGKGMIQQDIPMSASQAVLRIKNPETPWNDTLINLNIGHMDPVDQLSGQIARLNNLGYFAGPLPSDSEDTATGHGDAGNNSASGGGNNAGADNNASAGDNSGGGNDNADDNSAGDNNNNNNNNNSGDDSAGANNSDIGGDTQNNAEKERQSLFQSAVEEFQCDYHLTVDGVCGPMTRAKLLEIHGC